MSRESIMNTKQKTRIRIWSQSLRRIFYCLLIFFIQGVSEISALILTGNRTHQKEQLFSPPLGKKRCVMI
jgi:hypothetical protein